MLKMRVSRTYAVSIVTVLGLVIGSALAVQHSHSVSKNEPTEQVHTAKQMLEALEVRVEATNAPFDRKTQFGEWTRPSGSACTTRQLVLARDSQIANQACKSVTGDWVSPYDGKHFVRSDGHRMEIDHMVPEKEAWVSGAATWTQQSRIRYANDLGYTHSLIAVSRHANRSKGDSEPAEWKKGPASSYECTYIGYWIAVKYRWSLSVDEAEKADLETSLKGCGTKSDVEVPTKAKIVMASTSTPSASQTYSTSSQRFANCTQVIAHGLGPYFKGKDSEYDWYRDGDSDGKVCEGS